jgi:hypothetical protein
VPAQQKIPGDIDGNRVLDLKDVELSEKELTRMRLEGTSFNLAPVSDLVLYDYNRDGVFDEGDPFALRSWVEAEIDPDTGIPLFCTDVNSDGLVDEGDVELTEDRLFGEPGPGPVAIGHPFDFNRDGFFDADDLEIVRSWSALFTPPTLTFDQLDLNGDGKIDKADVVILKEKLKQRGDGSGPFPEELDLDFDGDFDVDDVNELQAVVFQALLIDESYRPAVNGDGSFDMADVEAVRAELREEGEGDRSAGDRFDIDQDCDLDEDDIIFLEVLVEDRGDNAAEAASRDP